MSRYSEPDMGLLFNMGTVSPAYFVENETETVYKLIPVKKRCLENKHPNWCNYNCEDNYEALQYVLGYFRKHGTVVASKSKRNVFVGLTV